MLVLLHFTDEKPEHIKFISESKFPNGIKIDSNKGIRKAKQNYATWPSITYWFLGSSYLPLYSFALISEIMNSKSPKYSSDQLVRITKLEEQQLVPKYV